MRGDFSRIRFNPAKHFTAVLEQQGRVALDADTNERTAIEAYLRDTANVDVIGRYGGPIGDAGFAIKVQGGEILIEPGRYYVEGILVENDAERHFDKQPHLIHPAYNAQQLLAAVIEGEGQITAQLSLEVWQRLVTQLDDGCLREPALGQADTTARLQTVWRVVGTLQGANTNRMIMNRGSIPGAGIGPITYVPSGDSATSSYENPVSQLSSCCQSMYGQRLRARVGAMGADTGRGNNECGCQPIPSAGYQGLENQLYRVEIHAGGTLDSATFKWSRENGSLVAKVTNISGTVVTVNSLGPDANLGFQAGQWVELSNDTNLFGEPANQPGQLYQIASLGPGPLQVTLATPVTGIRTARNARMRRWDQSGTTASAQGIPLSSSAVLLENGIEVTFRAGNYEPGDYWTIPARTANGEIDWPPCSSDGNFFQPPQFTRIYTAPLACIHLRADNAIDRLSYSFGRFQVDDCRLLFPPLTALAQVQTPPALHVQSVSWVNDDVMTVDAFLQTGLSITLDEAPSCPWSGANFQVTMESPALADPILAWEGNVPGLPAPGNFPAGTDVFGRTVAALDPPLGITVAGTTVNWLLPAVTRGVAMYSAYYLYGVLNAALKANKPSGFARVRIRLVGGAVYTAGAAGNLYLDGLNFGSTSSRQSDSSPCIALGLPSGNALRASDFEGWFYLAPSVQITAAAIQLMDNTNIVGSNQVTVVVDYNGTITGLQTTGANASAPTTVTAVEAVITLSYKVVSETTLTFQLNGTGVGTVVNMQSTATVSPGQASITVPIQIATNPGVDATGKPITDTVTLSVSAAGLFGNLPFNQQPSLAITGSAVPARPAQ
jgi:hypothetical protein